MGFLKWSALVCLAAVAAFYAVEKFELFEVKEERIKLSANAPELPVLGVFLALCIHWRKCNEVQFQTNAAVLFLFLAPPILMATTGQWWGNTRSTEKCPPSSKNFRWLLITISNNSLMASWVLIRHSGWQWATVLRFIFLLLSFNRSLPIIVACSVGRCVLLQISQVSFSLIFFSVKPSLHFLPDTRKRPPILGPPLNSRFTSTNSSTALDRTGRSSSENHFYISSTTKRSLTRSARKDAGC